MLLRRNYFLHNKTNHDTIYAAYSMLTGPRSAIKLVKLTGSGSATGADPEGTAGRARAGVGKVLTRPSLRSEARCLGMGVPPPQSIIESLWSVLSPPPPSGASAEN